jgi:hypothetical protein
MPYAAITYRVKPGFEDEIAEIFGGFQRVNTPNFAGDNGAQAGRLLGTAVFIKDDVVVRVIHYEGDFSAIGKHMAQQKGVHLIEEALKPYLVERESATSEADFRSHFTNATMRCISELSVDTHPVGS